MGILPSTASSKLSEVEKSVSVSAFCRRRLPVVMTRLRMAETVQAATKLIEQGHVRVGTEPITDTAFLVTREYLEVPGKAGRFRFTIGSDHHRHCWRLGKTGEGAGRSTW
jgi:ribosomal protein S4E